MDWDFASHNTRIGSHGIHPYPAKFIPQIPGSLIDLFHPGDDSAVLDPFCGSGTTLVEATKRGVDSIGIDLHPLATLIAKVKTTPLSQDPTSHAREVLGQAKERVRMREVQIPPIPRVDHWFSKPVQLALAALVTAIDTVPDQAVADVLRVALSSIIVRVSNQESDTRYAAIDKSVTDADVWIAFERAVKFISATLHYTNNNLFSCRPCVSIITRDVLTVEPCEIPSRIGLVVTSPPYPNAYEYWLYHKYRMYWLGLDPIAVREKEIGARPHYFKKNHQTEVDFERQMARCFWLLSHVMGEGCIACFVVGRSVIHGRSIDNEAILAKAASAHGFSKIGSVSRRIATARKSFNPAHGTINHEQVVAFKLEQKP